MQGVDADGVCIGIGSTYRSPWAVLSAAETRHGAEPIPMPPVFSAQAAGSIPHCAADRDGQRYLSTWLALDTQPAT